MNIIDKHYYFKYYNTKYYATCNLIAIIIELLRLYNDK